MLVLRCSSTNFSSSASSNVSEGGAEVRTGNDEGGAGRKGGCGMTAIDFNISLVISGITLYIYACTGITCTSVLMFLLYTSTSLV